MLKEDIIKDIQKYIQSNDEQNLIDYLETTFTHKKLYKTCVNAKLIKVTKKKPTSNTLALKIANKLMKTEPSKWEIFFMAISSFQIFKIINVLMNNENYSAQGKNNINGLMNNENYSAQEKNNIIGLFIIHSLIFGYSTKIFVDKSKTRKRLISSLVGPSSSPKKNLYINLFKYIMKKKSIKLLHSTF